MNYKKETIMIILMLLLLPKLTAKYVFKAIPSYNINWIQNYNHKKIQLLDPNQNNQACIPKIKVPCFLNKIANNNKLKKILKLRIHLQYKVLKKRIKQFF